MRVLLVSTNGLLRDGITSWLVQYFDAMDKTEIEPHAVAWEGADGDVLKDVSAAGIAVHFLPSRRLHVLEYLRALRDLLCKMHFNVVHVCGNSGTIALELSVARRCVVGMRVAHSRNTMCQHRVADKLLRPLMLACATNLYACGERAGKWLFGDKPFTVIPNGKDPGVYAFSSKERNRYRNEMGIDTGSIAIGHVGTFNEQKNHVKLLDIFFELRKRSDRYVLCLIGDGSLRKTIEQKVELLGIEDSVLFMGRRSDVPNLINAMDCMVFPSLYEGFPNVVLEWQLNGLPCVLSDTITDECAITPLVTFESLERNDACWADAVERALSQGDRRRSSELAAEAAKTKGYDIRDNAEMLKRLYLEGGAR